jgi:hypothetical protein
MWFVPVLCVAGVLLIGSFVISIFSVMRSSDAYTQAVARASASPVVQEALGTPIREAFFFAGKITLNGASGKAQLSIPLEGPKGEGTLHVDATKTAGEWKFDHLFVQVRPSGNRIDLLQESKAIRP